MKKISALILCTTLIPTYALSDTSLDEVIETFGVVAEREGDSAFIPTMTMTKDNMTLTLTNVMASEADGQVTVSSEDGAVFTKTDPETNANQTYTFTSPDAVLTFLDLTDTRINATLSADTLNVVGAGDVEITLDLTTIAGVLDVDRSPESKSTISLSHADGEFTLTGPTGDSVGTIGAFEGHFRMTSPRQDMDSYDDPISAIQDGFLMSMTAKSAGMTQSHSDSDPEKSFTAAMLPWGLTADVEPSEIRFHMAGEGGDVLSSDEDGAGYAYGAYMTAFSFPIQPGKDQTFMLSADSGEITPNSAAWARLGEGAESIPQTPITGKLKINGVMTPHDPATGEDIQVTPFTLKKLNVETFEVAGLGASVSAEGDVEMSPEGLPERGEGAVKLKGVNTLISALVASGIMTEDQAMSVRMPLAMFSKSDGEDSSTIEVKAENGEISLNGNRIR